MIFFSTMLNAKVRDSAEEIGGMVNDALIRINSGKDFPPVIGLVVFARRTKKEKFIPADMVENWGPGEIELLEKFDKAISPVPLGEDIVSLRTTVLDKQIVDLDGMRIVRVNDLQFGKIGQTMCLIAIDISTRGVLRRLGIRLPGIDRLSRSNFLEWKNVRLTDNKLHLATGAKELVKLHPADIANIIEKMNLYQGSTLLQSMDQATAARVLEEIQPNIKKVLIKNLGPERAAAMMNKMSIDELVDLIQLLPGRESREILNKLPLNGKIQRVKQILEYDEDTAGGLMTTEFITSYPESIVEEVIEEIKRISPLFRSIHFVYITDRDGKFLGVVSLRSLIVAQKHQQIKEIMRKLKKVSTVKVHQNLLTIASLMTKYNLLSVAVLDKDRKLLGAVTVDDIMRRFLPEA